jgi:asparagine synthase (glutamine-hydrolysing)
MYLQLFNSMFPGRNQGIEKLVRFDHYEKHFRYNDNASNAMNCDLHEYLPDDLLVKEDRASMAVTLEARVPLIDHELAEFAARIPSQYKIRRGETKYILKKSFEGILPHEILYRPKRGFGMPLKEYLRDELREYCRSIVFDFNQLDYYDKKVIEQLWNRHQTGRSDYSRLLWNIMMFNLWFKKWMM